MNETISNTPRSPYNKLLLLLPEGNEAERSLPIDARTAADRVAKIAQAARSIPRDRLQGEDGSMLRPSMADLGHGVSLDTSVVVDGVPTKVTYGAQLTVHDPGDSHSTDLRHGFDLRLDVATAAEHAGTIDGMGNERKLEGTLGTNGAPMDEPQVNVVTNGLLGAFERAVADRLPQ